MRRHPLKLGTAAARLSLALILCALGAGAARAQAGAAATSASVVVTAEEKNGQPVGDLKPDDIRVTAAGEVRRVLGLERRGDLPLCVAVALDVSASQEALLPSTKALADAFVKEFVRPGADSAAFVAFSEAVSVEQELTDDVSKVRAAIARASVELPPGYRGGGLVVGPLPKGPKPSPGSSGIWDTARRAALELMPPTTGACRRVVLLVSDGVDTSSNMSLEKAAADIAGSGAVVYATGVGDTSSFAGVDAESLKKLAGRTGGRAFFPKDGKDLPAVFAAIRADLLSQYVVTFEAPAAAREGMKLKVVLVNQELRKRDVRLAYPQVLPR